MTKDRAISSTASLWLGLVVLGWGSENAVGFVRDSPNGTSLGLCPSGSLCVSSDNCPGELVPISSRPSTAAPVRCTETRLSCRLQRWHRLSVKAAANGKGSSPSCFFASFQMLFGISPRFFEKAKLLEFSTPISSRSLFVSHFLSIVVRRSPRSFHRPFQSLFHRVR